jgi:antitoxin Phd
MKSWQIQEVKQHLSEVIRFALNEGPQQITYRGEPNAWIISEKDYAKLIRRRESLVDFFQKSPHRSTKIPIERKKDLPRKIDL